MSGNEMKCVRVRLNYGRVSKLIRCLPPIGRVMSPPVRLVTSGRNPPLPRSARLVIVARLQTVTGVKYELLL